MDILNILNENYFMRFDKLEQLRDSGSTSYVVFSGGNKYFLRAIKPAFFDTAIKGVDIQVFLQGKGFSVPPVVFTKDSLPYIKTNDTENIREQKNLLHMANGCGITPRIYPKDSVMGICTTATSIKRPMVDYSYWISTHPAMVFRCMTRH